MLKIQEALTHTASEVSTHTLRAVASLMVSIGKSATTLSAVPFWHCEPKIPQSMLDEIEAKG